MSTDAAPIRLAMTGVRKAFGATVALDDVDLRVAAGQVHALIGENGAGKSTLMKVLSGAIQPDAGTMQIDGQPFRPRHPQMARQRGVAMIYQELTLAPHLTVEQNVCLGIEQTRFGLLRRSTMRAQVAEALRELDHAEIAADTRVADLSIGAQQLVEVARALLIDARIIVMDEPTSSLTREDVGRLFALIRRLRDKGVSIIYISHFLEEVQEIADRFTVLRDGRTVGNGDVSTTPTDAIIEMMVGRQLDEMFPAVPHEPRDEILQLDRLTGDPQPWEVSLSLRRGEIFGLAGLIGAGRTELLRTLFGLEPVRSGRVTVLAARGKHASDHGATPARRLAQGIGLLSEDRKDEGLALPLDIADNVTLSSMHTVRRFGLLSLRRQRQAAQRWIERLNVRTTGPRQAVWNLSGGNQQKIAIARLLQQDADVLLLDEPTRGIDVGAKVEIYRLMGELAAAGKAVLFVSSYLPELMGVCDRIGVMCRGRLVEVRRRTDWTEHAVMAAATGGAA